MERGKQELQVGLLSCKKVLGNTPGGRFHSRTRCYSFFFKNSKQNDNKVKGAVEENKLMEAV